MTEKIEMLLRLGFFVGVLLLMFLWQVVAPRRKLTVRRVPRWASNLGIVVLNVVLTRMVVPLSAVGAAILARTHDWGLLHLFEWPPGLEFVLAIIAFDLAIYLQHVLFHAVPILWRLHKVHHADLDFDVTTGLRFHTLEIVLSAILKLTMVFVLGPSAVAVVIFEILLNATAMFNHSNIRIPAGLDQMLRWIVVTPDMHRVHHSVLRSETNSNFGFNVPWWDVLFGTYCEQPEKGHEEMMIGLPHLRNEIQADRLSGMLMLPFRPEPGQESAP